jgi:hypothetical protein
LQELLATHASPEPEDLWGASTLPAHGVMVRGIVRSSLHVPALLQLLWAHAKRVLLDREATAPRKTY